MKKEFTFSYEEYSSDEELTNEQRTAVKAAEEAYLKAYAPYSKFKVGAALLLDDNSLILGSNQENIAYPSGICAERVALFSFGTQRKNQKIKTLAITGMGDLIGEDGAFSPCGACRQVMVEYADIQGQPFEIILKSPQGKVVVFESIHHLLPFGFGSL